MGKESRALECSTPEQCGAVARQQHWGSLPDGVYLVASGESVGEAVCLVIFVVGIKN